MKKKFYYLSLIATIIATIANSVVAEDIVLLDAKSGVGGFSATSNPKKTADGYVINGGRAKIVGEWDFSKNLDFELDIKNMSDKDELPIQILLSESEDISKLNDPTWTTMVRLAPNESKKFVIEYPRPLKFPNVAKKMKGMRADPFGFREKKYLDLTKIKAVAVDRHWSSTAPFAVRSLRAVEHNPDNVPQWHKYDEKQFFPFIDKYGQFKFKQWPHKTLADADLIAAKESEAKDLAANPLPANRDKFGGWTKGVKSRSTGHFRFEKIDGKWWLIDPIGNLFWSHGVVRVTPSSAITPLDGREDYFENLPKDGDDFALFYTTKDELLASYYTARKIKKTYDFSAANIYRKYGKNWREAYADIAHKRLASWGLNTIANSSDSFIYLQRKTPYVERFEIKGPSLSGKSAWWPFRDPFNPAFRENVAQNLKERSQMTNDPWCIGLFVDNEIHWGDKYDLARFTLESPATLEGKKRFMSELKNKYGEIASLNKAWQTEFASWDEFLANRKVPEKADKNDLEAFTNLMTEEYFKVIREEFTKYAPNKLYLGCRFAGANENVVRIGAKYCDAVSYNKYADNLKTLKLPKGLDKPIMIGEWHFGAKDRGMFHPTLIKRRNQADRAQAYYEYALSALQNPNVVGIHWHQFSDQATTGRFDGENFQVGFTDVCDTPYYETIAKIREIGHRLYEIRSAK